MSSTEREARDGTDEENARKKKPRGDSEILGTDDATGTPPTPNEDATPIIGTGNGDEEIGEFVVQREGSIEVKVVTEGVKEVELEDKQSSSQPLTPSDSQDAEGVAATEEDEEETADTTATSTEEAVNPDAVKPEAVPLPEVADELDELRSSSPPQQEEPTTVAAVKPTESQEATAETSPIPDGPRLPRSTPRKLESSSPRKIARV